MLSDIDLTVVVAHSDHCNELEERIERLARWIPLIESESAVLTANELQDKLSLSTLPHEIAILYRYFEAQNSWIQVFRGERCPAIDLSCRPSDDQLVVLALHELQYWGEIVTDFTSCDAITRKTYLGRSSACWTCCKAVLEVENLLGFLLDRRELEFKRSEMLSAAMKVYGASRWRALFVDTGAVLSAKEPADTAHYIEETLRFLATRFGDFVHEVARRSEECSGYLTRLREASRFSVADFPESDGAASTPPRTLPQLAMINSRSFDALYSALWTPQPQLADGRRSGLLLLVVTDLRGEVIERCRKLGRHLCEVLRSQYTKSLKISFNIVHLNHLLAISVPLQHGKDSQVLWGRKNMQPQGTVELMLDASESAEECARAIRALSDEVVPGLQQ